MLCWLMYNEYEVSIGWHAVFHIINCVRTRIEVYILVGMPPFLNHNICPSVSDAEGCVKQQDFYYNIINILSDCCIVFCCVVLCCVVLCCIVLCYVMLC